MPIKQTMAYLKELADLDLKDNVIITDAGSTKREIVEAAERYLTGKNVQFVGSHPMAGSHKSGAIAADVTLFENAYYIFTPTSLTKETTIPELKDILSGLKSRYVEIDAAEHDRVTSQISHFPHLLASGLMEQAADLQKLGTALGLSDVTIATDLSNLGKKSSSEAATDISTYFVKYLTAYTTNIITETYTEAVTSGKPYTPQVSQAGSKDYVYANQLGLLIKAAGNIGASSALDAVVSNLSNNETINAALKQLTDGSQSLTDGLGELVKNNDTLLSLIHI